MSSVAVTPGAQPVIPHAVVPFWSGCPLPFSPLAYPQVIVPQAGMPQAVVAQAGVMSEKERKIAKWQQKRHKRVWTRPPDPQRARISASRSRDERGHFMNEERVLRIKLNELKSRLNASESEKNSLQEKLVATERELILLRMYASPESGEPGTPISEDAAPVGQEAPQEAAAAAAAGSEDADADADAAGEAQDMPALPDPRAPAHAAPVAPHSPTPTSAPEPSASAPSAGDFGSTPPRDTQQPSPFSSKPGSAILAPFAAKIDLADVASKLRKTNTPYLEAEKEREKAWVPPSEPLPPPSSLSPLPLPMPMPLPMPLSPMSPLPSPLPMLRTPLFTGSPAASTPHAYPYGSSTPSFSPSPAPRRRPPQGHRHLQSDSDDRAL